MSRMRMIGLLEPRAKLMGKNQEANYEGLVFAKCNLLVSLNSFSGGDELCKVGQMQI